MLTLDQILILTSATLVGVAVIGAYLSAADTATARHLAHVASPDHRHGRLLGQSGPPTVPILLGQGAGVPDTIRMPRPRPYTGDIPVLVVEGPPGTRGTLPADDLPLVRRPACSFCRDGQVIMARTACPWCGHERHQVAS